MTLPIIAILHKILDKTIRK